MVFYPKVTAVLTVVFEGQLGAEEGGKSLVVPVRPKSFTVCLNGYKEADTFQIEFDAELLPFSPDIIRAAAVEIYAWNGTSASTTAEEERLGKVPANLLIAGLIDDSNIHLDGGGRFFSMSGRDYTALMLDKKVNPRYRIPVNTPLKEVLQEMADIASGVISVNADTGVQTPTGVQRVLTVKMADELDVATSTSDASNIVGRDKHTKKGKVRNPLTAQKFAKTNAKGVPVKCGTSYWDALYRLVLQHGLIAYVQGTDVVINEPNVLTNTKLETAAHVAYGRNLASLNIDRKMAKSAVPFIRVTSYDRTTRNTLVVEYPADHKAKTSAIGTKRDEVVIVNVPGITSKDALLEIAQLRYEAMARPEAVIKFQTQDLKALNGASLLGLRAGDPVTISWEDLHFQEFKSLNSSSQRARAMIKLGYDTSVATAVAQGFERLALEKTAFYTRSNSISFDVDRGISFDVECVNYVSPSRDQK